MYRNLKNAGIYFVVHMLVEVICFAILVRTYQLRPVEAAFIAMFYDVIAFCPQFLFGLIHEKYKRLDMGSIGVGLMLSGLALVDFGTYGFRAVAGVFLIALGSAVIHECGAILTVLTGEGKLFPGALFVSGGSFGVIIGQTLGSLQLSKWLLLIPLTLTELLILLSNKDWLYENETYPEYSITKKRLPVWIAVIAAFLVTMTRGYLAYAIPIGWKKELWQAFLLFFTMGIGKALGGWLADRAGARRTAMLTILGSVPFLIAGENMMVVSIIGVFLFSMTMSITFGMLLSVMGENPGLAFGVTTMALGLGIMPVFFVNVSRGANIVIVIAGSIFCAFLMLITLKKAPSEPGGETAAAEEG